jgi:secondary thiamine-phosphate synthase enzyme
VSPLILFRFYGTLPFESLYGKRDLNIYLSVIELETDEGISLHNLMPDIKAAVRGSGIKNGLVTVTTQHTTTAIAINEYEKGLLEDVKKFLARLIPADDRYLHNDITLRDCPPDEPENAHTHLAAMLLGSSEVIPLAHGEMVLGQYQSVILYELDGPRRRKVSVQVYGK